MKHGAGDAFMVLDDADLTNTIIWVIQGHMNNTVQICCAANRCIVVESLVDESIAEFTAALKALPPGDPMESKTTLGPLSSQSALTQLGAGVDEAVAGGRDASAQCKEHRPSRLLHGTIDAHGHRFDRASSISVFQQCVGMTRTRGICALVGVPPGDFPVPLFGVVANCIRIRGAFVGDRPDLTESLSASVEGMVTADIELQRLRAIGAVFKGHDDGAVPARVVLQFQ